MTLNESVGSNSDLSEGIPSNAKNVEDETYGNKTSHGSYDAQSKEDLPILSKVETTKIGLLPDKFKLSASSLVRGDETCDKAKEWSKISSDGSGDDELLPPDGGVRAWMIMLGSFLINGILFSVINSYGVIYVELQRQLKESGDDAASSKAALVGALTIGTTFFLSPIAGILTDEFGIQLTTFLGGALACGGMLLASFFSHQVEMLYLTYGIMYGCGASLAYTPSLVILGHYFKRYLGFVNGIVTAGSSIFTVIIPYVIEPLIEHFGLVVTLRTLALLTSIIMPCAVLFKPVLLKNTETTQKPQSLDNTCCSKLNEIVNFSMWKRKKYVVWASAIPLALFGYFVPYVHIGKFVTERFPGSQKKLPVMCIGITSGIGRLVFGYIADMPRVNRILLQQISFLSIGVLTMLLAVTPTFGVLLLIALCMGLFDGCFISLLGPIAFDICGREDASQAIGFLLGMCSIPLTVGPPIAGCLFDLTGSYNLPFLLAGIPPIIGALAMFLVRCVKDEKIEDDEIEGDQRLRNGNVTNGYIAISPMEFRSATLQEGRSWTEIVGSTLLELSPRYRCTIRTRRRSYGALDESCASRFIGCNTEDSKHRGDPQYSESVPLINGRKTRMEIFDRTSPSSILLTC